MVKDIQSPEEFETELEAAGDKLVVVDIWAQWCGPCRAISPYFASLEEQFESCVFMKMNAEGPCEDLIGEWDVDALPTFKFFRNSEPVDVFIGADKHKLLEKLKQLTGTA
uniref:Thioredoxin n=1 Tax=Fibrocapsa japonica TaxID=94617 RepID=A0A7S2V0Z6_9STRA|mmetsp:Transcript_23947/g.34814  ORF Transcript_23947/g.34814 Transcript_23947/m.34814 type:complete len:110 (+) Transcript_23947:54-383(+)|eukprot:CAMPEP_0113934944 /NCGR_PEP_ID=MMETSP1339-20121228/2190_1 /TAXON_ID=94617 /ORGANISM="Fibrocapsa japonica" /LENGTH=109 /DNA_ID=CAMNT_0000936927 /DNA_START=52 /DNA_END=381 /DNA_ORIENTATION=+ /assembly_acc=CAM_ASM_000762